MSSHLPRARPTTAIATAITFAFLLLGSAPAAAYEFPTGGYVGGGDSFTHRFPLGTTEIVGASVRLLTNSTVLGGSVNIEGQRDFANRSYDETSTADFLSNTQISDMAVGSGNLVLNIHSDSVVADASNNFRNATLSGMTISGNKIILNGGSSGNFTTDTLNAPPSGWGVLTAKVALPSTATLTWDILLPNGTVIISDQVWGSYIDLDGDDYPQLRIRGTVSSGDSSFSVTWVRVGQVAGDYIAGSGVTRTFSEVYNISAGGFTLREDYLRFGYNAANPLLYENNATFFGDGPMHPFVLQVGGEWWMYFAANDSQGGGARIGRAVSTNLINWTDDPTPVLNGSAGEWDQDSVYWPFVMRDPFTSDFIMYYTGVHAGAGGGKIGMATSSDGVTWTKFWNNPVLSANSSGWDSYSVGPVAAVNFSAGVYTMWYSGNDTDTGDFWPFQGSSLGVATSSDGTNWTRYGANPVLTRGGGNDSYDMRAGHILSINGTMYFHYSCRQGALFYRICAATSTDGYAWTKAGIMVNATGVAGQWNREVMNPAAILVNNSVVMYFDGHNATGSRIGRADSGWVNGTYTGLIDLGARYPLSWTSVNLDADLPAGSSYFIQILASTDGSTWTTPENLTSGQTGIVTTASNYLQWNVTLRGGFGGQAPVLRGVDVPYSAYATFGDYRSNSLFFPEPLVSGGVSIQDGSPGAGTVDIEISFNNGTNWTAINNASLNPAAGSPSWMRYHLHVQGTPHSTPLIDAVTLLYETSGFPSDVSVRLDTNATPFFTQAGVFNSKVNVSLPISQLNAAIAAAKIAAPGAPTTDVTLIATSTHYGKVAITEPRLNILLKNPIYASFTPPAVSLQVDENTTNVFSVNATSYPPSVPVNISWWFDSVPVPSNFGRFNFTYSPNFTAAGTHNLFASMENGDSVVNKSWTVVVRNVNRVPFFTSTTPPSPLTLNHRQTANFTAAAGDPDGDSVTFQWTVDGISRGTGPNFTGGPFLPGTHNVRVIASDALDSTAYLWIVNSTNAGPVIIDFTPGPYSNITNHDVLTFSVTVTDLEDDILRYTWTVNNAIVPDNASSILAGPFNPPGNHLVKVEVSDGHSTASQAFILVSINTPPIIISVRPTTDVTVNHLANPVFSLSAFDAENDILFYEWRMDNVLTAVGTNTTTLTTLSPGVHNLTVSVWDDFATKQHSWTVTVTDAPPVISATNPTPGPVSLAVNVDQVFSVTVLDADGDTVEREWYIDGTLDANVTGSTYRKKWDEAGTHVVHFEASANGHNVSAEWTVTVALINVPATITSFEPNTGAVEVEFDHAQIFKITLQDDRVVQTRIVWRLDGAQVQLGDTYQFRANASAEGEHTLVAFVEDGAFNTSQTWVITVKAPVAEPPKSPGFDGAFAVLGVVAAAAVFAALRSRSRRT